jgi:hypothetical protein
VQRARTYALFLLTAAAVSALASGLAALSLHAGENRIALVPHLQGGQQLTYRVRYREQRSVHAESRVVSPLAPEDSHIDLIREVRVVVRQGSEASSQKTLLRVSLVNPDAPAAADPLAVEFALSAKGDVEDLANLSKLSPEEQLLWRAWVDRFTVAWSLPPNLRTGERWSTEEPIPQSLLAALTWQKESRFVNQHPCSTLPPAGRASQPQISTKSSQETCAVVLTQATLRQKSSIKDATPEDYKLHGLKTFGSARGSDEIISYIAVNSGIVVRATENSSQAMDAVVAKTDGSNRVHYTIQAESHTEIILVP